MGLMVQDLFLVHVVIGFSEDRINILDGRDSQCEAKGNANLGQAELFVQLCMDLFRLFSSCTSRIMRNSSPPMRKTAFVGQLWQRTAAADCRRRSPASWPN